MATKISLDLFEKNAQAFNKKGLLRSYDKIKNHLVEYDITPTLGVTDKLVMQVLVDKVFVKPLRDLIKSLGYKVLGGKNNFFIGEIVADYQKNKDKITDLKVTEGLDNLTDNYEKTKNSRKQFVEVDHGDVVFFFMPQKKNVKNLISFLEDSKEAISSFAKENDISIMLYPTSCFSNIKGAMAFNFISNDSKSNQSIDFYPDFAITTDFKKHNAVFETSLTLTMFADNKEDLEMINCHIYADNLIIAK